MERQAGGSEGLSKYPLKGLSLEEMEGAEPAALL